MWTYRGDFVELNAEQRSDAWFDSRLFRITASVYEAVLGLSKFNTKQESIDRILGKIPNKTPNEAMLLGQANEDPLRKQYSKQNNCVINEPSLCLTLRQFDFPMNWRGGKMLSEIYPDQLADPLHPNWFLGGSPDGEIYFNGSNISYTNLEIKFTKNLYSPLIERMENIKKGYNITSARYAPHYDSQLAKYYSVLTSKHCYPSGVIDYYPHIWQSHYMQMQGCMAILNKSQCVYLVGSQTHEPYSEIVPFDDMYWRTFLYPSLVRTVELDIKPGMSEKQLEDFVVRIKDIINIIKCSKTKTSV